MKRPIAAILACALLFQVCGCSTAMIQSYKPTQGWEGTIEGVVSIIDLNGQTLTCDEYAPASTDPNVWIDATTVESDTLFSYISGRPAQLPLNLIQSIQVINNQQFEAKFIKRMALIAGVALLAIILIPNRGRPYYGW